MELIFTETNLILLSNSAAERRNVTSTPEMIFVQTAGAFLQTQAEGNEPKVRTAACRAPFV